MSADALKIIHWWPPLNMWLSACVDFFFISFWKIAGGRISVEWSRREHCAICRRLAAESPGCFHWPYQSERTDGSSGYALIDRTHCIISQSLRCWDNGQTTNPRMHGRRANKRAVESGEKLFYDIPSKFRTKPNMRWHIGMYLGVRPQSGKH